MPCCATALDEQAAKPGCEIASCVSGPDTYHHCKHGMQKDLWGTRTLRHDRQLSNCEGAERYLLQNPDMMYVGRHVAAGGPALGG